MNNNTDCEVVYIHGPHGVTTETYPTVSDGEAYPLFPVPCPGDCILELYSVDDLNNEVDPFNLIITYDKSGCTTMEMVALEVVNYNPISNECLVDGDEPHCIYFGHTEVNIDDVTVVDDQNSVLGKLNERISLDNIPSSIKLKSKEGNTMRLKTHIIKL